MEDAFGVMDSLYIPILVLVTQTDACAHSQKCSPKEMIVHLLIH